MLEVAEMILATLRGFLLELLTSGTHGLRLDSSPGPVHCTVMRPPGLNRSTFCEHTWFLSAGTNSWDVGTGHPWDTSKSVRDGDTESRPGTNYPRTNGGCVVMTVVFAVTKDSGN